MLVAFSLAKGTGACSLSVFLHAVVGSFCTDPMHSDTKHLFTFCMGWCFLALELQSYRLLSKSLAREDGFHHVFEFIHSLVGCLLKIPKCT